MWFLPLQQKHLWFFRGHFISQELPIQSQRLPSSSKKRPKKLAVKRGGRRISLKKKKKNLNNVRKENNMYILGANSAGLFNKLESLRRNVSLFSPGVIFIQESKARKKNKLKLDDYTVFEHIRKNSGGGGLLTAVHSSLKPVSISNDDEEEILVVEANLPNSKVRFINGYGPQENAPESTRKPFFDQLDLEVKKAKTAGALVCIEMDSNAKLGPTIIKGDPKPKSENGKLLENVISENDLIVVNASSICEGTITRYRKTINGEEESVLDHFIVCREMFKIIKRMVIDELGKFSLTKYTNKRGDKTCMKESDHRTIVVELDLNWVPEVKTKEERIEVYDYKNVDNFKKFVQSTNDNDDLKHCFDDCNEDLEKSSKRWLKTMKNTIKNSFTKIRVKKKKMLPELEALFQEKENLKSKVAESENLETHEKTAELNEKSKM